MVSLNPLQVMSQAGLVGESSCGAQVFLYRQPRTDPLLQAVTSPLAALDVIACDGRSERDANPCIIGVQVQNALGAGGSFNINLKSRYDLVSLILDDDWVDIVFCRGKTQWHVMRGSIDEVRCTTIATPTGSTTRAYQITGRGFQKVWQNTPMWFENSIGEDLGTLDELKIFNARTSDQRDVSGVVFTYLYRFFEHLVGYGRAGFNVPPAMARIAPNVPFAPASFDGQRPLISTTDGVGLIAYDDSGYNKTINSRIAASQNFFYPDAGLWDAAMQWSDQVYCEMFTELLPRGGLAAMQGQTNPLADGLSIADSQMTCAVRDKPFVLGINALDFGTPYVQLPALKASSWFELPKYEIPQQLIVAQNVGRSGYERYNAFYTSAQVGTSSDLGAAGNLPNWNLAEIRNHGLRRFDGQSRYIPYPVGTSKQFFLSRKQQARDWYGCNGMLLQGSFNLGCGLPGVRVGARLHIVTDNTQADIHGYIESYAHIYQPGAGIKTQLGVTRIYMGDENQIIQIVNSATQGYDEAARSPPTEDS